MIQHRFSLLICFAVALTAAAGLTYADDATKITTIASTVPANGDVNPYGIAQVTVAGGSLVEGDFLISNFNNSSNLQGTGTTIVQVSPAGSVSQFAQINPSALPGPCPGGVGLTTALVVLRAGWVIVGSLPTTDGTSATAQAGCLIVLDNTGNVVQTITDTSINGPWDMTALDKGTKASLFVTNVLNGTVAGGGSIVNAGTVVRVDLDLSGNLPSVLGFTTIGSTFPERTDPAALVIGPTGVALDSDGTLFVADSLSNRVASIENAARRTSSAGLGKTLSKKGSLNDPLGLTIGRANDEIYVTNGNNGVMTRMSSTGKTPLKILLDNTGTPPGAGTLFGLAITPQGVYFVDDGSNTLNLWAPPKD